MGHRHTELQKNTLYDLQEVTVRETDEQTMTTHSVMKVMGEEHQNCCGKKTNFPCIVQGPVLWQHRGEVTNPTRTERG